jgi:hypothetical protein
MMVAMERAREGAGMSYSTSNSTSNNDSDGVSDYATVSVRATCMSAPELELSSKGRAA